MTGITIIYSLRVSQLQVPGCCYLLHSSDRSKVHIRTSVVWPKWNTWTVFYVMSRAKINQTGRPRVSRVRMITITRVSWFISLIISALDIPSSRVPTELCDVPLLSTQSHLRPFRVGWNGSWCPRQCKDWPSFWIFSTIWISKMAPLIYQCHFRVVTPV